MLIAYRNPVCADAFNVHPYLKTIHTNPTYRIYAAGPDAAS